MAHLPEGENLYVSEIFHKSFIEVNEEGTEAAALTATVVMSFGSAMVVQDKVDFVADHPFVFKIREDGSGVVMLIGQVLNPFERSEICYRETTMDIRGLDISELVESQTDVALRLTNHVLRTEAKDSNLVFSPPLVHVVLSLIAAGAKGPTLDQLLLFLKSKSNDQLNSFSSVLVSAVFTDGSALGGPRLSFANGVWVDKSLPLKPSFKQVVDNVYKAASNQVDFQTKAGEVAGEVNLWAENKTNGIIKQVLPPGSVDSSTRLIFANAIYFKGVWDETFNASKTKDYDFHLINGSSVKAPFMTSKKKQKVRAFSGFKILRLPYQQGRDKRQFSMYFFLPHAKDGLVGLVERISSESGFLERHLPYRKVEVGEFRIPKFKISFGFNASAVLKRLGIGLPFSGEGGLTEMVDSPESQKLCVSNIFHKSFIEVNEKGTEAAAATAANVQLVSYVVQKKIDFVADHPFLFLIREDMTGVVLFMGHILNPLLER